MICQRCQQEPAEQVYHARNSVKRARPVGSPGLHIRRMICACGCKSVELFFVFDYDRVRSHATQMLLNSDYFDLRAEAEKRGSIHGYA